MEEKIYGREGLSTPVTRLISPHEVPSTPFILSLVSGVLFLLGASMPLLFMGSFDGMGGMMEGYEGSGMMNGFGGEGMMDTGYIAVRIVGLVFAGIVLYAAIMLNSKPSQHVTWGSLIVVFSILGVFTSWAGFGIGLILGVIGGGLAIVWRPAYTMPPQASTPVGRFCPHCGWAIAMNAGFCSYCGQQLPG